MSIRSLRSILRDIQIRNRLMFNVFFRIITIADDPNEDEANSVGRYPIRIRIPLWRYLGKDALVAISTDYPIRASAVDQ